MLEVMFGRAAEQVSVKFSLVRGPDGDRGGRGGGGRLRWSFKVTVATHLHHVCNNNNNNTEKRKKKKDESAEKPQKKRQVQGRRQGRRQRSRRHPGPRAAAPRTPANVSAR